MFDRKNVIRTIIAVAFGVGLLVGCVKSADVYYASNEIEMAASHMQTDESSGYSLKDSMPETPNNENFDEILYRNYVDVENLPLLDLAFLSEMQFDDRIFRMEDSIDTELELLAFNFYYYEMMPSFEAMLELIDENEALRIAVENEQEHFEEGRYDKEITIHEICTFSLEDFDLIGASSKRDIVECIIQYQLTEYAIVEVDLTWYYNDLLKEAGPQLDEGRYQRYFLVGKTAEAEEFKIYEFYWDEYFIY